MAKKAQSSYEILLGRISEPQDLAQADMKDKIVSLIRMAALPHQAAKLR
jgi:hypothetical protein